MYYVIAEPGDTEYGLSGDELFAAIIKRHKGGAIVNPGGRDMFQPFSNMLNDLVLHGFITAEQSMAIGQAQLDRSLI